MKTIKATTTLTCPDDRAIHLTAETEVNEVITRTSCAIVAQRAVEAALAVLDEEYGLAAPNDKHGDKLAYELEKTILKHLLGGSNDQ